MAAYEIMVDRTVSQWTIVTVEADNEEDAVKQAEAEARDLGTYADWTTEDSSADDYSCRIESVDGEEDAGDDEEIEEAKS